MYEEALSAEDMRMKLRGSSSELNSVLDQCLNAQASRDSTLGFLASDVASDDPHVRAAYTRALKSLRDTIAKSANGLPGGEEAILASAAMIVGAIAITRTADDTNFSDALLDACRRGAETLLQHADVFIRPTYFWMPNRAKPPR